MLFTSTDDSEWYSVEVSLSSILIFGLFCSNSRVIIFSKTEKIEIIANA